MSSDRLSIYFSSNLPGNTYNIYAATRANVGAPFGTPTPLPNVNIDMKSQISPVLSSDELTLYFGQATLSGGFYTPIGELNSGSEDASAVFTADELTVFFYSNRPGTAGGWDVMTATRSTVNDGFGAPSFVTELNTPDCEAPSWVSPDGCDLILVTNRPGNFDLWMASRPR